MNRRTLLKGTAADSALMFSMRLGVHRSNAQTLSYTAEAVYEFTDFLETEFNPIKDGAVTDVSRDGLIGGRDIIDGVSKPVTWDLTGTRTVLDLGDISVVRTWSVSLAEGGHVVASISETNEDGGPFTSVVWANGMPSRLDAGKGKSVYASCVNGRGVVGGSVDTAPARWIDGVLEQASIPDGANSASVSLVTQNGDAYGSMWDLDGNAMSPFVWKASGEFEIIPLPADMSGPDVEKIYSARISTAFNDGTFVLSASWRNGTTNPDAAWLYQDSVPAPIAMNGGAMMGNITAGWSPDNLIGYINARGEAPELGGPAQWIDGVPTLLRPITTTPTDIPLATARGITGDGVIVGSSIVISDNAPPPCILVLRPN